MTFSQAYKIAMENSRIFREHDFRVKEAEKNGEPSACLIFSVEPDQTFFYGFDGVDMQKGKHTKKRAAELLGQDMAYLIIL